VAGLAGELDAAAGAEFPADMEFGRSHGGDQVVEDAVDDLLVEGGEISEGGKVEFERLRFHAGFARDVTDHDVGGIGLAGDGAERGEFRAIKVDPEASAGAAIREGLELGFFRAGGEAVFGVSEERQIRWIHGSDASAGWG